MTFVWHRGGTRDDCFRQHIKVYLLWHANQVKVHLIFWQNNIQYMFFHQIHTGVELIFIGEQYTCIILLSSWEGVTSTCTGAIWFRIREKGTNVLGHFGKTIYFWKGEDLIFPKMYSFPWVLWRHSSGCYQDFPYFPSTLVPFSQIRNHLRVGNQRGF